MTAAWTAAHLRLLAPDRAAYQTPLITTAQVVPLLPGVDFWDLWPVRAPDGAPALIGGEPVWAGLSAPATGHPGQRHDQARIRLIARSAQGWQDRGPLFPPDASAGSREWAGSLTYDEQAARLFAYYTAAGVRGEPSLSFQQRIMGASAHLQAADGTFRLTDWTPHRELFWADSVRYQPAIESTGRPGFIKAFRDPFRYDDPTSGRAYVLFTGSLAQAANPDFNAAVGIAGATGTGADGGPDGWQLLDPLITADDVNNELERPHIVYRDGLHYLFWSTQARTFRPGLSAPTGLYGFVAPDVLGPYEPLNGSGLVLRNPADEPFQAYSWLVLPDGAVSAFIDSYALGGRHPDDLDADGPDAVRAHFGGTMAPPAQLALAGATATVVQVTPAGTEHAPK